MKKVLISIIDMYQKMPLACHGNCRFFPTCSNYAKEAINSYGALRGSYMTFLRLMRCHPFGKMGYDPVPEKFGRRRNDEKK